MQVNVHAAKSQLSRLIQAALAGEEVVIAKGDVPVVKLVPLAKGAYRLGGLAGEVALPPDEFFAPLDGSEIAEWE